MFQNKSNCAELIIAVSVLCEKKLWEQFCDFFLLNICTYLNKYIQFLKKGSFETFFK